MNEELIRMYQILFDAPNDDGASVASTVKENNTAIGDLTKSISGIKTGEAAGKDASTRHIGYFEQDIGIEPDDAEPAPKVDAADLGVDPDDLDDGDLDDEEYEDDDLGLSDDDLDLDDDEADDSEAADEPDYGDKFYVPERDAKGRDPYPNSFETRMDAQFAISEKVDTFDKMVAELEENGSGLGAAIDPAIKEKIDAYRDLDYPGQVDDDSLKSDIVDIDEALKAVKFKNDRVKERSQKVQTTKAAESKYQEATVEASKSSQALGIPQRLGELGDDPTKESLMALVDEQIQSKLSEIDEKISAHAEDNEFLESEGLTKYNQEMDRLRTEKMTMQNELNGHKNTIDSWWDAQVEYRTAKDVKPKAPNDAEKAKMYDNAFLAFQEDRSEGPNALDIFTKSKDTKPIVHFRQYALKNANEFDLTKESGWLKAHSAWQGWIQENISRKNTASSKKKAASVKKRAPIKKPSRANQPQVVPGGRHFDGLKDLNSDIKKLSKGIMNRK